MAKMAHAGEYHGEASLICRRDDILIAQGATGLDDGGGTCLRGSNQAIGEGKEGIGRNNRALG